MKHKLTVFLLIIFQLMVGCTATVDPQKGAKKIFVTNSITKGQKLFPFRAKRAYGYINEQGVEIVKPSFDYAGQFVDGLARVYFDDGKNGYLNEKGEILLPTLGMTFSYNEAYEGKMIVCRQRDFLRLTFETKCGFIDEEGNLIAPPLFDDLGEFFEGVAIIQKDGKWGFINSKGEIFIEPQYEEVKRFSEGLAPLMINGKWGFIDKTNKIVIPAKFDTTEPFSEGLAVVYLEGRNYCNYVNKNGELLNDTKYLGCRSFSEGLAAISVNGKHGFINKEGEIVIAPTFEGAQSFSEGFASVWLEQKSGFINKEGKLLTSGLTSVSNFKNGLAVVSLNSQVYINKEGRIIWASDPSKDKVGTKLWE